MHWYKRDPNAALVGMAALTFEERGAYNSLLDLLYSCDNELADDDERIARMMNCNTRTWRKLKAALIGHGKVWVKDGKITAKRVEKELNAAAKLSEEQSKKARTRWEKSENDKENNVDAMPRGNASTSTTTSTSRKKEDTGAGAPDDWPKDFRDQFWSAYPRKVGRLKALKALESVRKQKLATWAKLISAVEHYARTANPEFTKHPLTWLNAGCWDDEIPNGAGPPSASISEDEKTRMFAELHGGKIESRPEAKNSDLREIGAGAREGERPWRQESVGVTDNSSGNARVGSVAALLRGSSGLRTFADAPGDDWPKSGNDRA